MGRLRILFGLAVSAVFLVLLLASVDRGAVVDAIGDANAWWFLPAAPLFAAGMWVRAMRWRLILRPHLALTRGDAASLLVIGNAANNVLPARTGEIVRALLVQRGRGGSAATTIGSIVIERALDGLVLAAFLIVTLAVAGSSGLLRGLAVLAGAGFLGATVLLAVFAWRPAGSERAIAALSARLPQRVTGPIGGLVARLFAGLTLLRTPRSWVLAITMTGLSWALEAGSYWLVGEAFALNLDPALYLGVAAAANLAIAAPGTSGGIGPFEFFVRETVTVFGASTAAATATATAYAIALHVLVLLPLSLLGLALLWQRQIGFGTLLGAAREDLPDLAATSDEVTP